MDGEFTLNENICDIDGMNTAASAFEELYESAATMVPTGDLVYLPNNPYTPQQLFFINTAQVRNVLDRPRLASEINNDNVINRKISILFHLL